MSLFTRLAAAASSAMTSFRGNPIQTRLPEYEPWIQMSPLPITQKDLDNVDAFKKVPIISAAVRKLAEDHASIPRKVWIGRGKQRREMEPTGKIPYLGGNLADLLKCANPEQTGKQMMAMTAGSIVVTGVGYQFMERLGRKSGPPMELWSFPGHLLSAVPGEHRGTKVYEYLPEGTGSTAFAASRGGRPRYLEADLVMAFRSFTLSELPVGGSWIGAGADLYTAYYYTLLWLKDFYKQGGIVAGVWKREKDAPVLSDEKLAELANRIRARSMDAQGNARRWGALVVQDMDYVLQGMKLSEMLIENTLDALESRLARLVGVPPTLLGIKQGEGSLSSSSATEVENYWFGTQKSLASLIDDTLNERLCPLYGRDVWVEADFSQVPAVIDMTLSRAETYMTLQQPSGILTPNEARTAIGLESWGTEYDQPRVAPAPVIGDPAAQDPAAVKAPSPKPPKAPPQPAQARALRFSEDTRAELRQAKRLSVARFRAKWKEMVDGRLIEQRAKTKTAVRAEWSAAHGTALRAGFTAEQLSNGSIKEIHLAIRVQDMVPDPQDDEQRARDLIEELLRLRMGEALSEIERAAGVSLEVSLTLSNQRAADFILAQIDRAISIPDKTTVEKVRGALSEGIAAGEGLDSLIARVDEAFDAREGQAMTIARTETLAAYNFASIESYRQSGVVDRHTWLTSHSGTGGRHSENPDGTYDGLDGQTRAIGEQFDVGDAKMFYPGDPQGPIGETANCACTTVPEVNEARLKARPSYRHAIASRLEAYWEGPGA